MISMNRHTPRALAFSLLVLACVPCLIPVASGQQYTESVVAVVNDEVITTSDVLAQSRARELELPSTLTREQRDEAVLELREQVLDQLIDREVLYSEFQKRGYQVPVDLMQRRLNRIVLTEAGGNRSQFERSLADRGLSMDEYEEEIRKSLAIELMVEQHVRRLVNVTPGDVAAYYRDNPDRFRIPQRFRLRMIFIAYPAGQTMESVAVARKLKDARDFLAGGRDFAEVARAMSDDGSAAEGGDLGWFTLDAMRDEFRDVVERGLTSGGHSEPLDMGSGAAILKVDGVQPEEVAPLDDDLSAWIRGQLRREREQQRYEQYLAELRSRAFVKIF
jgi:parvulin-like peptidyl-prolyl isomerase